MTSLLDDAARQVDALQDLDHDELVTLREDVERVHGEPDPVGLGAGGARALAVYACGSAGLLEVFEERLHPYLRDPLSGRVDCDVADAGAADVLAAATDVFEQSRRDRERAAIERLRAGLGRDDGLAVAGTQDVFDALEHRRVEVLLLEPAGATGWGEHVDDAIERTLAQSADVLVVRDHADLGAHAGIAALLRF